MEIKNLMRTKKTTSIQIPRKMNVNCEASPPCRSLPGRACRRTGGASGGTGGNRGTSRGARPRIFWSAARRARPDVQHTSRGNRRPILAVQNVFGLVQMWAILAIQMLGLNFDDFC